jgi:uncharacterized protein (TIGR03067 family)
LIPLCVLGADVAGDDQAKKELDKLKGKWKLVTLEQQGMKGEVKEANIVTISDDKYVQTRDGKEVERGQVKIDATKKPRTIDLVIQDGPDKGKTQLGVYELTDDTWKIALSMPGDTERPKDVAPSANPRHVLVTLKREKQ